MSDYAPVYENGSLPFTMTASATITGGQVLIMTGVSTVGPASGAVGTFVGVAAHDAVNTGRVSVWPLAGLVHETITTSGATAAGALSAGASGVVEPGTLATLAAAGTLIGTAVTTATAGNKIRWIGR